MLPYIIGAGIAVVAVVIFFIMMALRRVVPTNEVHIVQSQKKTVSYGKDRENGNVYYQFPPSFPAVGVTVTVLPESVFSVQLTNYEAYDKEKIPFLVDVMAFFRVSDSNVAAHRVAHFNDLENQLSFILKGAVRAVLGKMQLESIMVDRTTLGIEFTNAVSEQLGEWGVQTVKSIEFMDIRDAPGMKVIEQITSKDKARIERESREAIAVHTQAARQKEIEAQRQVDLSTQEAALQVGKRTAETQQAVGISQQQAQQQVLEQRKETATREMDVKSVEQVRQAEIDRDVAKVTAERDKAVNIVNAEASKQTMMIAADAEKSKTVTVAEGQLSAAKYEAQGIEAKGTAQAKAREAVLLAETAPQITLAKEIGSNAGYQSYLVSIKQIEALQTVGEKNAEALKAADIKVIATGGDAQSGIQSISDLLGAKGGQALAAFVEGLSQTDAGKAAADRLTGRKAKPVETRQ